MLIPTYKLLLVGAEAAISEEEKRKVENILSDIPEKDYTFTIEPTLLNPVCEYTLSIIILRRGLEEAAVVEKEISAILQNNGIVTKRVETTLLWDESSQKMYYPIE